MRQQTMAGVTNEPIQKDMLTARFGKYLAILLLMSVVGELHAATYFFASSPSLRDVVTADAYLGNSDDVIIDGANPQGAASQTFFTSIGTSAFFVGQMTTQGLTPFGPTPAHIFGANEHTSVNIFGPGISASLNTDTPSIITTDRDQSYTASFVLNDTRSAGGRVGLSGIGYYLKRSQIASELYSGDLLTHFETVIPLLHRSWQGVGHQIESWEILDGPRVGATGMNTVTFFTFDGVPQEPPVSLPAPWVTTGFAAQTATAFGVSIQVGGTQFGAGTAELPSGSFDTASLNVGFGAPGAVTISGAGTELNMDQTSGGGAVSVGSGFSFGPGGSALGSLKVIEGATIDGGFLIDVGGFSSLNPGVLEVSGAGSGIQLTCGTGCKRLGNSISGRVLDPASGLAGVNVHPGGHVSVANGGQIVINTGIGTDNLPGFLVDGTLRVDGAGSRIALIGDGDGPLFTTVGGGNFAIGGKTLNPASVEVTNGAQIVLQGTNTVAGIAPGPTLFSPGAAGRLLVEGGGSLFDAGSLLFVGAKSDLSGPGGVGELKVATGGRVKADLIFIGTNGTVTGGGGTLEGMVEVHGMLAPGSSPGTMNIEGDLNLTSDGHVLIEIAGNTPGLQYDVLNVSGAANLDGTLEIVLLDGFTPGDTDTFDFINALSFIGSFDNLILPTFGSGKTFALNFGPAGITAAVSAVPVPAALPLLASALLFGGVAARRTRHCHGTRCELSL